MCKSQAFLIFYYTDVTILHGVRSKNYLKELQSNYQNKARRGGKNGRTYNINKK